jgi:hypothetical protein
VRKIGSGQVGARRDARGGSGLSARRARSSVDGLVLRRGHIALLAGTAACVLVGASAAAAQPLEIRFFQTPSKRIHCAYVAPPASLRCDIDGGLRPRPPRPARCELDWAQGIWIGKKGRAHVVCAGDTAADPSARVVGYGQTWRRNGFTCRVRRVGLTCRNAVGHGFFLSAESWRRF